MCRHNHLALVLLLPAPPTTSLHGWCSRRPCPADGSASLIAVLDDLLGALPDADFLSGLPALRQAFAYFPPRERERIAARLLERRGVRGSARSLLRTTADPLLIAEAMELEERVRTVLAAEGLAPREEPS